MMFAVIEQGGKQHRVEVGSMIIVDRINRKEITEIIEHLTKSYEFECVFDKILAEEEA